MVAPNTSKEFWARVNKNGPKQLHMRSRCWVWKGKTFKGGYGRFQYLGKARVASRVAWFLKTGQWPKGACHHCDVPGCVRFSHLFEGGPLENNRDCLTKGRKKTYPGDLNPSRRYPEKVKRGEQVALSKFTAAIIKEVREKYASGRFTQVELALMFNISKSHVCGIIKRRFWRHI